MKHNSDFQDFMENKENTPPRNLDDTIYKIISKDLTPSTSIIFFKLLGLQLILGSLTMLFCPQFELSLTNHYELFHYFHHNFGDIVCMIICGFIFMGPTGIMASIILSSEEIRTIKFSVPLYYMAITGLSMSLFLSLGASFYFEYATIWAISCVISSTLCFELGRLIKYKFSTVLFT